MKKFFTFTLIAILLIGVFMPIGIIHATAAAGTAPSNTGSVAGDTTDDPGWGVVFLEEVLSHISMAVLWIMSWLLWAAGTLLNFVIQQTILNMSGNISAMTGIGVAWRVVRDVLNMAFIFLLLYNAILITISQKTTADIKKVITGIVITALLINFSMFFTEVIIDASNIATIGFYNSIIASGQQTTILTSGQTGNTQIIQQGISGAFVNYLQVTNFWSSSGLANLKQDGNNSTSFIILGLGGSVLFLVLAFVFFAVSAMFVIRYIVLIFLLMLSPLGFVGFGLPQLSSAQKEWWNTLMGQAIFAPLYMILTWVILTLVGSDGFLIKGGSWSNLFLGKSSGAGATTNAADPSSIGLVLNFVLVIGLVIFSLTIAKKYASQGSTKIAEYTGKLTAFAGGAVMGGAAMVGKNTLGRGGNATANSEWLKDKASKSGIGGWAARQTLKGADRTARSTFDARNTTTVKRTTGALGMNIGQGTKNDFRKTLDAKAKKAEDTAKKLKPSDEASKEYQSKANERLNSDEYKNSDLYKNAEKEKAENEQKANAIKAEEEKKKEIDKEIENLEREKAASGSLAKQKEIDEKINARKLEADAQNKKLEETKKANATSDTAQKARNEYEKNEKDKNALYSKRVNTYADTIEKAPWYKRYAGSAFKGGVVAAGASALAAGPAVATGAGIAVASGITTRKDRKVIASKVRKLARQKSLDEQASDLVEKIQKEKKEKEGEEKTPKEPKPEEPTKPKEEPDKYREPPTA